MQASRHSQTLSARLRLYTVRVSDQRVIMVHTLLQRVHYLHRATPPMCGSVVSCDPQVSASQSELGMLSSFKVHFCRVQRLTSHSLSCIYLIINWHSLHLPVARHNRVCLIARSSSSDLDMVLDPQHLCYTLSWLSHQLKSVLMRWRWLVPPDCGVAHVIRWREWLN